jgi:hypothetical protein
MCVCVCYQLCAVDKFRVVGDAGGFVLCFVYKIKRIDGRLRVLDSYLFVRY